MTLRPLVPVLLALAVVAVGCGDEQTASTAPQDAGYVTRVQALLDPAGRMAALAAGQIKRTPDAWPPEPVVTRTLERQSRALRALRELRIANPGVRAQRDRLLRAFTASDAAARRVGRALVSRDRAAVRATAPALFTALEGLASATS